MLRFSLSLVLAAILTPTYVFAEHRGAMGEDMQQQQQQQPVGGVMGGGMTGGGGETKYESKADQFAEKNDQSKGREGMLELAKQSAQEAKAAAAETIKYIQSNIPKDEKLDKEFTESVSAATPADMSAVTKAREDVIAGIEKLSLTTVELEAKMVDATVKSMQTNATQVQAAPALTVRDRIQMAATGSAVPTGFSPQVWRQPSAVSGSAADSLASSNPGTVGNHNAGAGGNIPLGDDSPRAFRRGLLHNPPVGLDLQ